MENGLYTGIFRSNKTTHERFYMVRIIKVLSLILMAFFLTISAYPQKHDMTNKDDKNSMKGGMMDGMMQMDSHFIQRMIPHHQEAIDMAKLALEKSKKPEIKKLAQDIIKSQTAEIESMKKWYKEWFGTDVPDKPVKSDPKGRHKGMMKQGMMMMDMGMGHEMMGGTMDDLKKAADFDKVFLEMMIRHHKMAVMMSAMILDSQKPQMRSLGKDIIAAQSAEIEMMIKWYQNWYGSW